jgi:DNA primase
MRRRNSVIDFAAIAAAVRPSLPALVGRWLPDGRREGNEWVARNPTRSDRRPGSFKVNLRTGRWADFASGDKGGDAISLAAHLHGLSQLEAARKLAGMLGIEERAP